MSENDDIQSKLEDLFAAGAIKPTVEMHRKSDKRTIHVDDDDPAHLEHWKKQGFKVVETAKKKGSK